jgi:phage terminase Nu1 subunit (DNA packaging protein)
LDVSTINHDRLGQAINIAQVAQLLGCSVWTVRQRYMPHGLPYLRASAEGKLVFFREQVIDWILKQQKRERR